MIHPSGCFDYVAEFTAASFRSDEIVLDARSAVETGETVLLGHRPKLRFWNDLLVIMASGPALAATKWTAYPVGDGVFLVAKAGDTLQIVRSGTGDFALSIVRQAELVFALGAVTRVNLGRSIVVTNSPDCVDVHFATRVASLRARESVSGDSNESSSYHVYVERMREDGIPGTDECVSIVRAGTTKAVNAAIRGAVLLANERRERLRGEGWDGRFVHAYPTQLPSGLDAG